MPPDTPTALAPRPSLQPPASYSFTMRVHAPQPAGSFARVATAIGDPGTSLGAIDLVRDFAMANPTPEVRPEQVRADVAIMATGRSDHPNQINKIANPTGQAVEPEAIR